MNSELARIHARICGDGNISKYKSSESDRDRRAEVVYTNKSKRNIKEFREDLKSCFDVKGTVYEDRLRLKSIRVVEELESKFGKFGSKEFEIPSEIKKSEEEIKYEWLRAFIRDEGYYDSNNDRLRIKIVNKKALEDIQDLYTDLNIESKLTGPNCDDTWYLTVSSLRKYARLKEVAKNKPKVK